MEEIPVEEIPVIEEILVIEEIPVEEEIPVIEEISVMEEIPVEEIQVMEEIPIIETITLGKMKDLLKQNIPKPNTLDSYVRTIQQVHNHFKIEDMSELFKTKKQEIIS